MDHAKYEQPIAADVNARDQIKIYSVDDVMTINPRKQETLHFRPFVLTRMARPRRAGRPSGIQAAGRWAIGTLPGRDVYVVTVDLTGRPKSPNVDVLHVSTTRMNGDLPSRLHEGAEFQLQGAALVSGRTLLMVDQIDRAAGGRESAWRLISLLSLNYLSLVEEGKDALQGNPETPQFHQERRLGGPDQRYRNAAEPAQLGANHGTIGPTAAAG